jgi:hypothetical protein
MHAPNEWMSDESYATGMTAAAPLPPELAA